MESANPVALLVFLEEDLTFHDHRTEAERRAILLAGLQWESPYWVDLAVRWVEQGYELDQELSSELQRISKDKRFPQNLRHRAGKLAHRFEQAQGEAT